MHRVLPYVFLLLIALTAFALPRPAAAGDYYYNRYYDGAPIRYEGGYVNDGYRYRSGYRSYDDGYRYRPRYRYGASDCCYRRVVRYKKVYRDYERPYYSGSYYGAGYTTTRYYGGGYRYRNDGRSYYSRSYYGARYDDGYERSYRSYRPYTPQRHYGTTYYGAGYYGARYGYGGNYGRYASQPRTFHVPACTTIRYKVYDDLGGWVWGKRRTC